jgi:surfeit locus 1 family protein
VEEQLAQSALEISEENLRADLYNMEYREAIVLGEYDHDRQVVLRNQDWQGRLGVHLLTPLIIQGSDQAIMVNRGWIPYEDFEAGKLSKFDESGLVEVNGVIRRSQTKPRIGGRADQIPAEGEPPLQAWNWINVGGIAGQLPYELLPVYLQGSPEPSRNQMPYRTQLELDLNEGSHLGYAFQWFTFALILAIGYPIYVSREEKRLSTPTSKGRISSKGCPGISISAAVNSNPCFHIDCGWDFYPGDQFGRLLRWLANVFWQLDCFPSIFSVHPVFASCPGCINWIRLDHIFSLCLVALP